MGEVYSEEIEEELNYDEEPFVIINIENQEMVILKLCNDIFTNHLSDDEIKDEEKKNNKYSEERAEVINDNEVYVSGRKCLIDFLKKLPKPLTVVQEGYHIDPSFRDTYYMYFSNQHFQIKRYSQRISFLKGNMILKNILMRVKKYRRN